MPTDTIPTPQNSPLPVIPTPLLVSLATPPVLCALVAGRALTRAIIDLGLSSEEVFRGDRLPVLPFLKAGDFAELGEE
jgi:hypothetical protein